MFCFKTINPFIVQLLGTMDAEYEADYVHDCVL